jgi:Short C-terminal domain
MEQDAYNRRMQEEFDSTQRVAPYDPEGPHEPQITDPIAELKDLAALHASGALSDEEFEALKTRILSADTPS